MQHPTEAHFFLVKRILRYRQGTLNCGLTYKFSPDTTITAYSNSDWAIDILILEDL